MKVDISTNFDTAKNSVVLFVICNGRILLKRYRYEGVWCCESDLGKFIKEGEDAAKELVQLAKERLGLDIRPKYIFTIVSYINKPKPDGRVKLSSPVYLAEISEDIKDKIKKDPQHRWMSVEEVNASKEIRADDKLILTRILGGKYQDIIMDVDQMGKWGKPTLLGWKEA